MMDLKDLSHKQLCQEILDRLRPVSDYWLWCKIHGVTFGEVREGSTPFVEVKNPESFQEFFQRKIEEGEDG